MIYSYNITRRFQGTLANHFWSHQTTYKSGIHYHDSYTKARGYDMNSAWLGKPMTVLLSEQSLKRNISIKLINMLLCEFFYSTLIATLCGKNRQANSATYTSKAAVRYKCNWSIGIITDNSKVIYYLFFVNEFCGSCQNVLNFDKNLCMITFQFLTWSCSIK